MATDVERLVVSLEASITKYERAMQRALGQTNRTAKQIETRFQRMANTVNTGMGRAFAAIGGTAAIRSALQLSDAATRVENSLKVAGLSGEELTRVYDALYAAAQRNAAPIEALVTLYGRAALVQNELGVSTEELLRFTDNVALALRVSGQSAQEASGALLQLSQALGSGVVRAEEFNSILEGAPTILQAVAAGISEANGSVAQLRTLMLDGKISSEAFFRGFEAGAAILEDKVAGAELTVSQGFVRLQNILVDVAGKFNENTDASRFLNDGLEDLGQGIQDLAGFLTNIIGPIETFLGGLQAGIDKTQEFAAEIARITGGERLGFDAALATNNLGLGPGLQSESTAAGRVLEQSFRLVGETPQDEALAAALAGKGYDGAGGKPAALQITVTGGAAAIKPISLSDYAAPAGSGGAGGGRNAAATAAEREADAVKRLIADLQFERSLIGLSAQDQAQMNALRDAGAAATIEQQQQISALTREIEQEQQAADALADMYEELGQIGQQAFQGIIDAMSDGKIEGEELLGILGDVASQLANMFLSNAFGQMKLGGGGGLLGGKIIPGILHSGGSAGADGYGHGRSFSPALWAGAPRYHSGGIAGLRPNEIPAILERGETVIPAGKRGGQIVQIIDQRSGGQAVQQETGTGPNGESVIRAIIRDEIASPRGQSVMRNLYGVRPGTRRS